MSRAPREWFPLFRHLNTAGDGARSDDLLAGVITAILLIPQGMAYALLAGLPPEVGLYASIVPPFVYAFLGSSRALAVGPVAVAALMVASALAAYADGDQAKHLAGALILAAEVGILLLMLGLFRLGALVSFISHPVLSGFTTGAAILIITSQLGHITGIGVPRGEAFETLHAIAGRLGEINPETLVFGAAAILLLVLAQKPLQQMLRAVGLAERAAVIASRTAPLGIVIVTTVVSALGNAESAAGVTVVGAIPAGLPTPTLSFLGAGGWLDLLPSAVLIALVGYVESVSVAKALATRRRQKVDANQELTALGAANVAAAVAGAMPVAGGFSRSVVNFDAGARTQLAAIITSALVALVALFFTGWFYHLPNAVLAAIIVVAVAKLIDMRTARRVWAYDRADGVALVATIVAVLALGIEAGLLVGIGLSLALYLWRTSQPHLAVIGRVPGTEHFRNVCRHVVETDPRLLVVRVDENLYFANAESVESYLMAHLEAAERVEHVVLVLSAVSYIDSSALEVLEHLEEDLRAAGVTLHLAEVKGPVMDRLLPSDLYAALGDQRVFLTTHQAVEALQTEQNAPEN
jgi:SulP family sulfate permease